MCGASGNVEGSVLVRRGKLSVTVSPTTAIAEGKTDSRVDATRADTGTPVLGLTWGVGPVNVGNTGSGIYRWTAPAAPGPAAGWVKGGALYEQASFTVTVQPKPAEPPPPATTTQVRIVLTSPAGPFSDVQLLTAKWMLRPLWAGGTAVEASGADVTVVVGGPPSNAADKRVAFQVAELTVTYKGVLGVVKPVPSLLLLKQWAPGSMRFDALLVPDGSEPHYDENGTYLGSMYRMLVTGAGT